MIIPSAIEPVSLYLFKNSKFTNNYDDHIFRPTFKKNGVSLYSMDYSELLGEYETLALTGTFNFNYNNGLVSSVILEIPTTWVSSNYMYVRNADATSKYFYFITNFSILNHSDINGKCTVKFDLELDVIETYKNEILGSLKNYPIEVERKHCQRFALKDANNVAIPYCSDLVLNEKEISRVNPNIIKKLSKPSLNVEGNYSTADITTDSNLILSNIKWLYLGTDFVEILTEDLGTVDIHTTEIGGVTMPLFNACVPLVKKFVIKDNNYTINFNITDFINYFFNDAHTFSMRVSPYPPFNDTVWSLKTNGVTYDSATDTLTFEMKDNSITKTTATGYGIFDFTIGATEFKFIEYYPHDDYPLKDCLVIVNQEECDYHYNPCNIYDIKPYPTTSTTRDYGYEIKSNFSPYTKVFIKAQYGDAKEIHPELCYAVTIPYRRVLKETNLDNYQECLAVYLDAYATGYIGDFSFSIYPNYPSSYKDISKYYKEINNGYIHSPNYSFPNGSSALSQFSNTQSNQFTTQKVGQVIGGVLAIVGGVMASGTGNTGLGVVGIASGVASIGTAIGGATAKYADLENTPDTISNIGGTVVHDNAIGNTLHPYLCIYELTPSEKEMINDYFYEFGYNVQRCCYFNDELYPSNYATSNWVDERIFTRNTFNYVKLSEDITNKIDDEKMPFIVKKKISDIFKKGIRLWTFFDKNNLYDIQDEYELKLFKKEYENAEVY